MEQTSQGQPEAPELPSAPIEYDEHMLNDAHARNTLYDAGIMDMADETISAHNREMSVVQGMVDCPPFSASIRKITENMTEQGVDRGIIRIAAEATVRAQQSTSASVALPGSEKK